ncbi:glutamate--cysteine ligase [Actinomadura sp. DC4]|uniref:carboxylate-amine ligase n=1 Tax=Actinomadura sp. DC4 TaxID=3055069 RepID=UPI0025B17ED0|nr:glutamate--cysteine ligase [Actinomadura sp. DC4]MDN3359635.1 glutamate--cysteine ligase [Actinomadura sp. DC4]
MRSFGVEEELLLVDPGTGTAVARSEAVTGNADDAPGSELQRQQVETDTAPCTSLDELAEQVRDRRASAAKAAEAEGCQVAALATSPLPVRPKTTAGDRYERMIEAYALTAQEQLTCGCHVHVGVESDEEGVAVLDRIRPWLPPLLAMTANSPFWQGDDSGYASYRQQVWGRWPSAGPTEPFGTPEAYHEAVRAMIDSGALLDEGMVYFDARLSRHYPTVEVRIADVCGLADDAVLLAAVVRGLVETAAREWRDGEPPAPVRTEVLRLASWRASRSGLTGELVHPVTGRPASAGGVMRALLDHVEPALSDLGDRDAAEELMGRLVRGGTGADLQRRAYKEGDLAAVVREAVSRTLRR